MKSNIPSGYMHVQPVPEGRSLRDALDHGHFCVCCCSKVCAGNYLPWCECAVRGFWIDVLGSSTSSATQHIHCTRANLGCLSVLLASLLYPCFKTALRCDVVSGCFVRGASPSPRFRPELAPERGLGGPGLAFRTPESARKVHAKSFRLLCGTGRVVVLKLEVRLGANQTFFGSTVSHLNTEITIFKTRMHEERPFHTDSTSSSEAQSEKSDLRKFLEQAETAECKAKLRLQGRQNGWWVPAITAMRTFADIDSAPRSGSQAYLRALRARSGKRTSFSAPRTSCTGRMICGHVGELARTWP